MIWLEAGGAIALLGGVFWLLVRSFGPTRSVAHVLYDTEHPANDKS